MISLSFRAATKFLTIAALCGASFPIAHAASEPDNGQVAVTVAKLLEQGQYSQTKLDDAVSARVLDRYIGDLDYAKLFFTEDDVATFKKKYATQLDDDILLGNLAPAYEIYDLYKKRVTDRVGWVKKVLEEPFEFNSDRTVTVDRKDAPRPKTLEEADELWRSRIENELLSEKLNKEAINPPVRTVTRRYDQILRNINERERNDQTELFLNSLATTYDPHSEYFGRSQQDSFNIQMKLSLVGIGAVLKSDDGYTKVAELVAGGPADRDGRLKVGDRISAVGQDKDPMVDIVDMRLDKVVEQIRGKKGTTVRLQVIPAANESGQRRVIEIVRDEVQLKEKFAKAELVERPDANGKMQKLGWITLPSFYADMQKKSKTSRSTTRDVLALIKRLQKENIDGLVMDLRRDGGGSLEEAVNLTGLFITEGPVVQYQTVNGGKFVLDDKDPEVAYDGPLVVLTNKFSASASEIFAAALQDYGRAVVVGDSTTFGKGTVQTMLDLNDFMPLLAQGDGAGALKLTIQKFYRVSGGSTQLRGVASDILLPSLYDTPKVGEVALENPLPYDEIPAKKLDFANNKRDLFVDELRRRSGDRVVRDQEFKFALEDITRMREQMEKNALSLNEKTRRELIAQDEARKKERAEVRAKLPASTDKVYELTLDDIDKPVLSLASNKKAEKPKDSELEEGGEEGADEPTVDAIRGETLNILTDLVNLSKAPRTASAVE
ncbi:MAG TPA: carboxy terminal-processing peptidase [Chthoniobacterales bacterium]|jgi:carboxyl-terminal processing protease